MERQIRLVQPLVELRTPFALDRDEIDAVDRGAPDADWDPVVDAARRAALAEDRLVFGGDPPSGVRGIVADLHARPGRDHAEYDQYPTFVAKAVDTLRRAGVDGPYAIVLGPALLAGGRRVHPARRLPGARAARASSRRARCCGRPPSTARWW